MFVTYLIYAERQHVHIPTGGKGGMGGGGSVGVHQVSSGREGWLKDFFGLENFGKYFLGNLI